MIYTFLLKTFLQNLKREPHRFNSVFLNTTPGTHHLLKAIFHIKDVHRFELTDLTLKHYSLLGRHLRALLS